MMTSKQRKLDIVVRELADAMRASFQRSLRVELDGAELREALNWAAARGECFEEHFRALDRLAMVLIKGQHYREAAIVSRCAIELMDGVRAVPLDGPSILQVRSYLLAKMAHAASHSAMFSDALKADKALGEALISVLRSEVDFPVDKGGIAALVKHLVSNTCAPKVPLLLTHQA